MTKIPSVEQRVEEFEKLLDESEGITAGEDIVPYVYDIITADRTALLTELREHVNQIAYHDDWDCHVLDYDKIKAHLDELIKSNSV